MTPASSSTASPPHAPSPPAPVAAQRRIFALDLARGVAILGIFVMNMRDFAMPLRHFQDPLFGGGALFPNLALWAVGGLLFEDKMIALLSLLFGAGIVLLERHAREQGQPLWPRYWRRHVALFVFGVAHAVLLWYGDILNTYAVCGLALYPLRRLRPRTLIVLGLGVYCVALAFRLWPEDLRDPLREVLIRSWHPRTKAPMSDHAAYHGSWLDLARWRAWLNFYWHVDGGLFFSIWRCGGAMLIGMALMKLDVLTGAAPRALVRRALLIGYGLGVPLVAYGLYETLAEHAVLGERFGFATLSRFGDALGLLGSLAMGVGHAAALATWARGGAAGSFMLRLAAAGRMALTLYLMQTVIAVIVFDGWALGRWGRWTFAQQAALVLGVWILQLAIAKPWLERFAFGPCEWLWRAVTYGRRPGSRVT
jgi:uncharacterized protein